MGSYRPLAALAALLLVPLSGGRARAAEPSPPYISPKAGTARVEARRPAKPAGPTPMVRRGLILPSGLLDPYLSPFAERPVGGDELRAGTSFGAVWGFLPEMHLDVQIGPNYLTPRAPPGMGRFTVTGRFVQSRPVDLGASFMVVLDPNPGHALLSYVQPGLPAILRPNEHLRIDTGIHVPMYPTGDRRIGLRVPLNVYVQPADRYHLGATSALFVPDTRDPKGTTLPVGLTGGYTAGPELSFLAITPYVTWTNFYQPATGALDTRSFVAGVIADFIIDLR
ncbi:hypothetical protein [Polyangium spumosum]|uniref:Transporter n=1 Tax=Polyangium spumosum TaxID=889282 RepID=A0A6N7PRR7_9BACT|nr:hypothetical protein [Polyangium spumosum]MRG93050.1 hypothetical protein [Polyangium spumosum]